MKRKARAGFEPANDGFANRCLSQLGDRARRTLEGRFYPGEGKISITDGHLDVFYPVDKDPQVLKPLLNSWLPDKSEPIRCGFLEPAETRK